MIKILLLALSLIYAPVAHAQFAAGYAPSQTSEPEEEQQESDGSVLFHSPAEREPEPRPQAPVSIQKPTPYPGSIRILAMVNGDIITTEDINHRVRAFCMTTGIPYNEQTKMLIINKVMQNTIDEKLKLQDATRTKIDITEKEIDNSIIAFSQNNNISSSKLEGMLKQFGVSKDIFREQLKTDLAWIRLVRRNSMSDNITQPEIEDALDIARKDMSKQKFMLMEIVVPQKESKHISQLVQNLRNDPRFELYAAQFSQAPSSSSGGRLGWVNIGQMPAVLEKAFTKLQPNQISDPVRYNDEYHIFKVEKKFNPETDKLPLPSNKEIENMLKNQKNEQYAAQHMQELRQRAIIELRE